MLQRNCIPGFAVTRLRSCTLAGQNNNGGIQTLVTTSQWAELWVLCKYFHLNWNHLCANCESTWHWCYLQSHHLQCCCHLPSDWELSSNPPLAAITHASWKPSSFQVLQNRSCCTERMVQDWKCSPSLAPWLPCDYMVRNSLTVAPPPQARTHNCPYVFYKAASRTKLKLIAEGQTTVQVSSRLICGREDWEEGCGQMYHWWIACRIKQRGM